MFLSADISRNRLGASLIFHQIVNCEIWPAQLTLVCRCSALAGRNDPRDVAKKTVYFDKTFMFTKASKFEEKEGEESEEMLGT